MKGRYIMPKEKWSEQLKLSGDLFFTPPLYYANNDKTPFCPRCWEKDKNAIHVILGERGHYYCPECKRDFYTEDFDPGLPMSIG